MGKHFSAKTVKRRDRSSLSSRKETDNCSLGVCVIVCRWRVSWFLSSPVGQSVAATQPAVFLLVVHPTNVRRPSTQCFFKLVCDTFFFRFEKSLPLRAIPTNAHRFHRQGDIVIITARAVPSLWYLYEYLVEYFGSSLSR